MAHLEACNALLLECNHDAEMLAQSTYPPFLKKRVAGPYGHLSNTAAAEIASAVKHPGLRHVVAAHLSVQNNRPALAQAMLAEALSCTEGDIVVAGPDNGCGWLQV